MTAVGGVDLTLATKSLDLCQALIGQGQAFTFTLTHTGTSVTFSLDTRMEIKDSGPVVREMKSVRKKLSPSQIRRNHRRKEEFLKRKSDPPKENNTPVKLIVESAVEETEIVETTATKESKCDQCGKLCKSENGLKTHIRKSHKNEDPPPQEKLRHNSQEIELMVSPIRDTRAEPEGGGEEGKEEGDETEDEDELSFPSSKNDPRPINGKCGFVHWDQCLMAPVGPVPHGLMACIRRRLHRVGE